MQVGDIVWFDPNKPNPWGAFSVRPIGVIEVTSPFKVKIYGIMEDSMDWKRFISNSTFTS